MSSIIDALLPAVVAVLMFGLGLSLTGADFRRVLRSRRAVGIGLACQLVLLPAVCLVLVSVLGLPGELAVGMMLLAASPGGTTASLFSHLARGDVALNISLTALNSLLSVVTLPVVVNLAIRHFLPGRAASAELGFTEVARLMAIVLVPVLVGMAVRARRVDLATRLDRPIKVLSVAFLTVVAVLTVYLERSRILDYLGAAGLAATLFCLASLTIGYLVPRLFGVAGPQAVAAGMDVGIHNSGLAVTVALSPGMLASAEMAVPAVVYAIVTIPCAAAAVALVTRDRQPVRA
ncbi:bile acid:sodium symporter family protein [Micromonospora echinofusca]|uniref:Bile acid:sodium symporter family protein n=1 Tax=Micromonospora echinofusca TaxID=47858 RepID=A0ABS3VNY4_MICEH|nr:bile acid:sodium symporter family protein [Micromonospora echinofusca]MBO4206259.1 bile acid:sodium symporter family protein [Micromonospora echinofusca]